MGRRYEVLGDDGKARGGRGTGRSGTGDAEEQ